MVYMLLLNFLTKRNHTLQDMLPRCFGLISKNISGFLVYNLCCFSPFFFVLNLLNLSAVLFLLFVFVYLFEGVCSKIQVDVSYYTHDDALSIINGLFNLQQDSFYHNLTEEELTRVQDYNFDHPGQFNCTH